MEGGLGVNLDDGEMWIPSDIFPTEEVVHQNRPTPPLSTPMEDLSRHFNFLNYQPPVFTPNPPSFTQQLRGMTQFAVTTPTPNVSCGQTVGPMGFDYLAANYHPRPVYQTQPPSALHFPIQNPVYPSVVAEQSIGTRLTMNNGRSVQWHQQNRPLIHDRGCEIKFGMVRDSRDSSSSSSSGTGVFIPLISPIDHNYKQEVTSQKRATSRKLETKKKVDYCCNQPVPPPELGLPKEWSY